MSEAFPVILTLAAGLIGGLSLIATLFMLYMAREEGRYFMRRTLDQKGIDVIRHEPLSNRLKLITVHWNGKYFQAGKEALFFGIEKLINPGTDAKTHFNSVVSRMCTWSGAKRPVLIATDTVSHIANPDLLAIVARAQQHSKYASAKPIIKEYVDFLSMVAEKDATIDTVTFLETIKPDDLTSFLEDLGSRDGKMVYDLGKRVNELERAKGMQVPGAVKIVVSLALVGIILIIAYLAMTGKLQTIIDSVAL